MSRVPRWGFLLVGLVLAVGCGGTPRLVRLETGRGEPITFIPRPSEPVEVDDDDFTEAMEPLARDVRPSSSPHLFAYRLLLATDSEPGFRSPRRGLAQQASGASARTWRTQGTVPTNDGLTQSYRRWCERKDLPGDCLRLLAGGDSLDVAGRRTLALSIALDSVWDETFESLENMADPIAVQSAIVTSMAVYLTLWLLPEPVSKGAAAVLTASLIAWLGYDTVWGLIRG
ncbi:SitA5 family polymorphic toxin [Myxococcus landrumensis]|uniref:Lipoprotein n=1 Tax=Myxococcus landrumensis TaxID=2813577 RepID=A0ABX7MZW4_9BACT|nr:hypothetical protein [Myxococcus landrumus]QSQ11743.1 hypothetical protein JY572_25515 [Myxococcus landrumus]